MEHALIIGSVDSNEPAHVTTIDSLVTRPYGPSVEAISPSETPAQVRATDEDIALATQYEQNLRELIEWSSRGAPGEVS